MATAIVAAVKFSLITCCGEYKNICAVLGMFNFVRNCKVTSYPPIF